MVEKSLTYRLYLRSLHHRYLSSQIKHNTRLVMTISVPNLGLRCIARIVDCKRCFNTSNHQRYELGQTKANVYSMNFNPLQILRFNLKLKQPKTKYSTSDPFENAQIFENAQTFSEYKPLTKCCTKNLTIPPSFKFNIIQSFAFILTPYILHLIDLVRFDIS